MHGPSSHLLVFGGGLSTGHLLLDLLQYVSLFVRHQLVIVIELEGVEQSDHQSVGPSLANGEYLRRNERETDEGKIGVMVCVVHDLPCADVNGIDQNADKPTNSLKPSH
jgi:hypothetical protein